MGCRGAQLYVAPVRELGDQGENMGRKLFDKNLKVFRKINPDIHSALKSLGKAKKNLVSIGDDDWDLIHEGKPFYGTGAKEFAKRQVSEFWKMQSGRVNMHPPQPETTSPLSATASCRCLSGLRTTKLRFLRTAAISEVII